MPRKVYGFAAALSIGFAAIQLSQLNTFGATWDEPLHALWGETFARYWQTGDHRLVDGMPGRGAYYGPLYYWANYVAAGAAMRTLGLSVVAAHHLLNVLVSSLAPGLVFLIAWEGLGARVAWFATGFLMLFPAFIAHGHYNPSDIPLLSAVSLLAFIVQRAMLRGTAQWARWAGAAFGLAMATKIVAIVMLPVIAAVYAAFIFLTTEGARAWRRDARAGEFQRAILFTASAAFVTFAAWPSLWGDAGLFVRAFRAFLTEPFFTGNVLYFGRQYGGAELPWHYTPMSVLIETPLVTAVCGLVGVAVLVMALRNRRNVVPSALALAWLLIPLAASLKPGLIRYNGLRQFFFVVPALAIVAGVGLDTIAGRVAAIVSARIRPVAMAGVAATVACWLALEIAWVHPYEGSFVNQAVRLAIDGPLEEQLPLEYWGASYKEGFAWLDQFAVRDARVCVPIVGGLARWYPHRADLTFGCDPGAQYTMFMTSYDRRAAYESGTLVFSVRRYGSDLARIYQSR